jgi:hypothetical protein
VVSREIQGEAMCHRLRSWGLDKHQILGGKRGERAETLFGGALAGSSGGPANDSESIALQNPWLEGGDMRIGGTCWRVLLLLLFIFLVSTSNVQSQDIFSEMNQLKGAVSDLKKEISNLTTLVNDLRKSVLRSVTRKDQRAPDKGSPSEEKAAQPSAPVDEKQVTRTACAAVGKFFEEAEASLRSSDSSITQARMTRAWHHMNAALQDYARTHRVSKLLAIYEGVAWDTYVAVQLRESVQGNEDFLKALAQHKQKYLETCPKE